jgi:hypothetical protein
VETENRIRFADMERLTPVQFQDGRLRGLPGFPVPRSRAVIFSTLDTNAASDVRANGLNLFLECAQPTVVRRVEQSLPMLDKSLKDSMCDKRVVLCNS